ncbi:hypothetical protein LK996_08740 [Lysobacter sp. A6]|uniref:Uncharacterized protein n=1 Tax=Noviluteimonas lactosilytica TaxID=2888523 RepID=A0ABS8JHW6_9GAMM|nr:hypothetical protein [Lysobacter lactosilyticus]MCC8363160.1 hypothetical protein [Lysobacter lactosilyticus]
MEKQPHRRIEKIAENRWFQNQPRMDDHAELGTSKALAEEDNAPPKLSKAPPTAPQPGGQQRI